MTDDVDPTPRTAGARWILAGLITLLGAALFAGVVNQGRADSAVLFVALPVLLAAGLTLTPHRTAHGRVFAATTIALLLAAVALHEGAVCVLLAAPLVYAVAHGTTALIRALRDANRPYVMVAVPLLLLPGLEGSGIAPRVAPEQTVEVTRVVGLPVDRVGERLATGPRPTAVRSVPLRLLGVPTPGRVTGDGLDVGDRWMFGYHGSAHGPGGHLLAEVESAAPGRVGFRFVEDSSITARWFTWRHAELSWRAVDPAHTEVRVRVDYTRGLDPSWYFGPLQQVLLGAGVGHLLDMLALE
ncbi:hypothetical protein [Micromonospora chokoriensis]|uniref:Polyketide cyclase / dehydrase and lipid transport n=1 Tax=Micromonospora chokoriensis TaxID=356851 RepID=A0A1C4UXX9_9ACTN|nr:hypothetical protein [Micromonospora chokoriensis]SCE76590.1 hypothetical protein GA0070612_0862 [Micromonospora chokoriensis]